MVTPSALLDELYRTDTSKVAADTASIVARMALAALLLRLSQNHDRATAQTTQATHDEVRVRERLHALQEHERTRAAREALRYTRPPVTIAPLLPGGGRGDGALSDVPVGLDVGMVRLASCAGAALAHKVAGVAPTQAVKEIGAKAAKGAEVAAAAAEKPGVFARSFGEGRTLKTMLGLGAVASAGYIANKAMNKANKYMSEEAAPADWGNATHGAPSLSFGVNQYGYATRDAPIQG